MARKNRSRARGRGDVERSTIAPKSRFASFGALAICAVTGLLLALPWLWTPLGWLTWPVIAAISAIVDRSTPRQAFARLWLIGFVTQVTGFYWLPEVLTRFAGHPAPLAWFLCLALHALGAVRFGLVGWLVARFGGGAPIALPVAWTALEFVWPSLFPWRLGQSQFVWPAIVQIAEFTGAYGVTFLVAWGGAILNSGQAALRSPARAEVGRPLVRHAVPFALVLGPILAFGHWRMAVIDEDHARRDAIRVALIQPGNRGFPRAAACGELSRALPADVDLIIWPETAVGPLSIGFTDFGSPAQLEAEGRPPQSPLTGPRCYWLVGADSVQRDPEAYYNSAILVGPDQRVLSRYHKRVLIPFGEYIPGEHWFPSLRRFSPWEVAFSSGSSAEPLVMGERAKLGICICYEDLLPDLARESVANGANLLVNLTNDAWFGDSHALMQHQQLAAFRTIENRRTLIRCTTTGSTSVIAPTGRVERQAPVNQPAALICDVKTCDRATFYTRFGDVFAWGCLLILLARPASALLRGRSAGNRSREAGSRVDSRTPGS